MMMLIATFLDPRYKTKNFKPLVSQNVKIKLGCLCHVMIETAKITPFKKKLKLSDTKETKFVILSIAKSMKELLASSSDEESQSQVSKDTISIIENYLKLPRLEADKDQLFWWRYNCKSFPFPAELARTYSACPSTSVASERLFSGAGLIYDEKRNKLSPERAQKLLFLKNNLLIINFKWSM